MNGYMISYNLGKFCYTVNKLIGFVGMLREHQMFCFAAWLNIFSLSSYLFLWVSVHSYFDLFRCEKYMETLYNQRMEWLFMACL